MNDEKQSQTIDKEMSASKKRNQQKYEELDLKIQELDLKYGAHVSKLQSDAEDLGEKLQEFTSKIQKIKADLDIKLNKILKRSDILEENSKFISDSIKNICKIISCLMEVTCM